MYLRPVFAVNASARRCEDARDVMLMVYEQISWSSLLIKSFSKKISYNQKSHWIENRRFEIDKDLIVSTFIFHNRCLCIYLSMNVFLPLIYPINYLLKLYLKFFSLSSISSTSETRMWCVHVGTYFFTRSKFFYFSTYGN